MQKDSRVFYFRRMPWALIGALVLSLLSQQVLRETPVFWKFCYGYCDPRVDDVLRVEARLNMLPANDQSSNVFLLGSSRPRRAFAADYLTHAFLKDRLSFQDLTIVGANTPIDMYLLKSQWLRKKPAMVIYLFDPNAIYAGKYEFSRMRFFDPSVLPYFVKYLGYQEVLSNWKFLVRAFLGEIFLFYKYRNSFVRIIEGWGRDCLSWKKIAQPKPLPVLPEWPRAYFLDMIEKSKTNKFSRFKISEDSELNKALLYLFAKGLIARGIKLIVVRAPEHPLLRHKVCDKRHVEEKQDFMHNDYLQDQSKEIGFAYVNAESLLDLDETDFVDAVHLSEKGRAKFTRFMENYLSSHLSSAAGSQGAD